MTDAHTQVAAILWDWTGLRVEDNGSYWLVAGSFAGQSHAGTRADPVSLALDLKALAGSGTAPAPVAAPVPEPVPAAAPAPADEELVIDRDALADLIREVLSEMAPPPPPPAPPPEPGPAPEPAPAPEAPAIVVPEALAGFVIADEAPGETKARLAGRWVELTHLLQMGLASADEAAEHTLLSAYQGWLQS